MTDIMMEGTRGKTPVELEKAIDDLGASIGMFTGREAITIQAVDIKTGRQMTGIVRYGYGDDGLPVFDEPSIGDCEGQALECRVPSIIGLCRDHTLKIGRVA